MINLPNSPVIGVLKRNDGTPEEFKFNVPEFGTAHKIEPEEDMNIQLLLDRILVLPDSPKDISKGGIIIPETAKEKPQRGTVKSVGPGKKGDPISVSVGDVVMYGKHVGMPLDLDGVKYLILRESDLIAIL